MDATRSQRRKGTSARQPLLSATWPVARVCRLHEKQEEPLSTTAGPGCRARGCFLKNQLAFACRMPPVRSIHCDARVSVEGLCCCLAGGPKPWLRFLQPRHVLTKSGLTLCALQRPITEYDGKRMIFDFWKRTGVPGELSCHNVWRPVHDHPPIRAPACRVLSAGLGVVYSVVGSLNHVTVRFLDHTAVPCSLYCALRAHCAICHMYVFQLLESGQKAFSFVCSVPAVRAEQ